MVVNRSPPGPTTRLGYLMRISEEAMTIAMPMMKAATTMATAVFRF